MLDRQRRRQALKDHEGGKQNKMAVQVQLAGRASDVYRGVPCGYNPTNDSSRIALNFNKYVLFKPRSCPVVRIYWSLRSGN